MTAINPNEREPQRVPPEAQRSGVYIRGRCDKCGGMAVVELPVGIARAWRRDTDMGRVLVQMRDQLMELVHDYEGRSR